MPAGAGKIGTTRRGIGPAYEDKVGRRAIRVCDLAHLDELEPLLDRLCAHHDALRAGFGEPPVDRERLRSDLAEIADFVLQFARRCGATSTRRSARGTPHPVRGRARRAARRRPRHLSVRHLVEHGRRRRPARARAWAVGGRLRARHRQGLHDPRRVGPLPDRAGRRDRPAARRTRPRVRHGHRPPAPLRLVRRGAGAPVRPRSAASPASR